MKPMLGDETEDQNPGASFAAPGPEYALKEASNICRGKGDEAVMRSVARAELLEAARRSGELCGGGTLSTARAGPANER